MYMDKRRKMVAESKRRYEKVLPMALETSNKEEVKMETTRQMAMMRDSMSYLADGFKAKGDSGPNQLKEKFFDEIGEMKVQATFGKWTQAKDLYDSSMNTLNEFQNAVGL